MSTPALKAKLLLLALGMALGVLLVWLALPILSRQIISAQKRGTEFESIADFRHTMLDDEAARNATRPDGLPFASIINPHPDDRIIYELRANLDVKFTNVRVITNSCGLRSPERPRAKPANTYRIALLGDSFAFGWGVPQDQTFAQVLEDTLNSLTRGVPKVEVMNLGVPGYSTFQEVAAFRDKGLAFEPDTALIFFIHNDFDFPFFVRDNSKPAGVVQSFSLPRGPNRELHPKLAEAKSMMQGLDPPQMLREFDALTKSLGIKSFLTINPRNEWKRSLRKLSPALRQSSIEYIDLVDDYNRVVKLRGYQEEDLSLPNDLHPSALRARIYGELLAPPLWAEIERSRGFFRN
ncbi:MAG: SGNH/GDSL hydrolase family protein [Proteobacteria bacterium]|nr:SGNH/GDSL hydrolase family protein [Pseudomonadota bacterium]